MCRTRNTQLKYIWWREAEELVEVQKVLEDLFEPKTNKGENIVG